MTWSFFEDKLQQFRGRVNEQWGIISDDRLDVITDKHVELTDMLQGTSPYEDGMERGDVP
jgi:uncharacterized protein YjbJ (UPF0337 family)